VRVCACVWVDARYVHRYQAGWRKKQKQVSSSHLISPHHTSFPGGCLTGCICIHCWPGQGIGFNKPQQLRTPYVQAPNQTNPTQSNPIRVAKPKVKHTAMSVGLRSTEYGQTYSSVAVDKLPPGWDPVEMVVCIPLHRAGTIQAENLSHGNATMQPWDDLPVTATKRADGWGSGRRMGA
jgi:hypothetical protein